ncbi:MAG: hypothetical protein BWY91_02474 [bacterium ADurb.BinA028]|nr:MAG: hypothetical protein BWY91_02474 [bacterium ADurb.BinA028]
MVQQDVLRADRREEVALLRALGRGQVRVGHGDERRVLELGPVEVTEEEQAAQVQRGGEAVGLGLGDTQLAGEQVQNAVGDGVLDLEPHRRAEAASGQLLLQRREEVLGVVLFDLEVFVAGHPEGVVLAHLHAGEQLVEVDRDDVFQGDEPGPLGAVVIAGLEHPKEPGQHRRHLDPGEVLRTGLGVDQDDGEVERKTRDVGERVGRVDGQRGEHREDLLAEQPVQRRALGLVEVAPAHDADALFVQRRTDLVPEDPRVHPHEFLRRVLDPVEQLARLKPSGRADGEAGGDAALEPGDPDHEELVEVAGEDREELRPFDEGDGLVHRQLQHALVELQPRDLALEVALLRQIEGDHGPCLDLIGRCGVGHPTPDRRRSEGLGQRWDGCFTLDSRVGAGAHGDHRSTNAR